jgi:hypothetical protein
MIESASKDCQGNCPLAVWSVPAERSGDGALDLPTNSESKAVSLDTSGLPPHSKLSTTLGKGTDAVWTYWLTIIG